MGELIAAFVEGVVGLVTAFLEVLPAILEALLYILAASVTIIAYAISPRFRQKKRKEWADKPKTKYLDLGISGVCLVALLSLAVWLSRPRPELAEGSDTVQINEGKRDEDVRLRIKAAAVRGLTNDVTVAVKKGGTRKIFETDSLNDLRRAFRENVTVVHPGETPTGSTKGSELISSETNRVSPAAGSRR